MKRLIGCIFTILLLSGCGTTSTYYLGAKIPQDEIVLLTNHDLSDESWQDLYLNVNYSIVRQGDQLLMEGRLSFADYPKMNLAGLWDLTLTVYLVNSQGTVEQYFDLVNTLGNNLEDVYPFRKQFTVNEKVTGMAFGYEGQLVKERSGRIDIWKLPKRGA